MSILFECKNENIKTHILHLHEEVIRNIFRFLSYEDVYFTIRNVCRQLRYMVDDYIEVAGRFVLSYGPETSTKQLFVFKRNNHIVSLCFRATDLNIPQPNFELKHIDKSSKFYFGGGSLGATINDELVIGIYYWEDDRNCECYSHYSYYYDKAKPYFVKYNTLKNNWKEIESFNFSDQMDISLKSDIVSSCLVDTILGESMLVFESEHRVGNSFIHYNLKQFHNHPKSKENRGAKVYSGKYLHSSSPDKKFSTMKIPILFKENEQMNEITDCAIINSNFNEVMLVGGKNGKTKLNRKLWKLHLQKVSRNGGSLHYQWIADSISMITPRVRPICFKLKNSVFIAGGQTLNESDECICLESEYYQEMDKDGMLKCFARFCRSKNKWKDMLSCDRYDILEDNYYESCHSLSCPINDVDKVVTDVNETFAIITRRNTGTCLIFTEESGFKDISKLDIGENPKHPWGYYMELRSDHRIFFRVK